MKKIKYLIIILLFLLTACTSQKDFQHTLNQDTLAVILHEMHLYRSYYQKQQRSLLPPTDSLYTRALREVLQRHKISEGQFLESLRYHLNSPDSMKVLYEKVLDIATHELARTDAEEKKKASGKLPQPR